MGYVFLTMLLSEFWQNIHSLVKLWPSNCVYRIVVKKDFHTLVFSGKLSAIVETNHQMDLNGPGLASVIIDVQEIQIKYVEAHKRCRFIRPPLRLTVYVFTIFLFLAESWRTYPLQDKNTWQFKSANIFVKLRNSNFNITRGMKFTPNSIRKWFAMA